MGLVKFNKTATKAQAANNYEQDVLYFTTDGYIYLNGNQVGGNYAYAADRAYVISVYNIDIYDANEAAYSQYRYVFHIADCANLPPSSLIESAAEYQDIDIVLQSIIQSYPTNSHKQVCELTWPNGTNGSNADITPVYEKWQRIIVGSTFYEWQKVYSSEKGELEINVHEDNDTFGVDNIAEFTERNDEWFGRLSDEAKNKIFHFVKNGGTDITFNIACGSFSGVGRKKASYVAYYSDSNDGTEHVVVGIQTNGIDGSNFYMNKLDITGFA